MSRYIILALAICMGCATVGYTGRRQLLIVSETEEQKLGQEAYLKILKESQLSTDKTANEMLQRVGARLAAVAEAPHFKWEFSLIKDDKSVNAFCLPGGKVSFYTGILPVTKTETGMAVVMGHEIAHALARHGAERMSQGMLASYGGSALNLMLSKQPAATRELYGQAYGTGVGIGLMLPFSRSHESEADHIGLILMAKAGYDPHEAVEFWKRMEQGAKEPQSPLAKYVSTHPSHDDRIRAINGWMDEAMSYYKK